MAVELQFGSCACEQVLRRTRGAAQRTVKQRGPWTMQLQLLATRAGVVRKPRTE